MTLTAQALAVYALRDRVFGVLTEAQWRVLLDLRHRGTPECVTSCCIASGAPATTALRHLDELVDSGWLHRERDPDDRRKTFLSLSEYAVLRFDAFDACEVAA